VPNKNKLSAALAKLKYLVIIDPLATETSEFWQNHGEFNDVPRASRPRCSACPPPALPRKRQPDQLQPRGDLEGSAIGRRARPRSTRRSWRCCSSLREMYAKDGGAFPDPSSTWPGTTCSPGALLGRAAARDQRQGPGRRAGPGRPGQPHGRARCWSRPGSSCRLCHAARRRLDRLRLLDLLRCLDRGRQPDGAPRLDDPTGLGVYGSFGYSGRPTAASCTTAPAPTPAASPGRPTRSTSTGTARPGPAPTCPT
jgi:hypothetical protein